MKTGSRLIEDKKDLLRLVSAYLVTHRQEVCKLDTLAFTTGERAAALSELYV